ncbi:diphosphomevalonate decarboxylase [Hamiltosporidium magnivora]|uniref:Diphosphomevalonate decarboxylase n=1 Tax=Hamiltosporidium magnivora TaxID=148818 RepID=A0A4Q9LKR8_9MICR|nr:diphosphomevalonate decarboxylase [Hamiltosporidium magnivora]
MTRKEGRAISHPNIALVKYWGKKDIEMNISSNMSVSLTLKNLETVTVVSPSEEKRDIFILNGHERPMKERMIKVIQLFKKRAGDVSYIKIDSKNNFPDSCGLASSASGFSALVKALNNFYDLNISTPELTEIARYGSGSSSRSIYDGFVCLDGVKSYKVSDWDDIKVFVILLEDTEKKVSSTEGMIRCAKTSNLYNLRLKYINYKAQEAMEYIKNKDFTNLAVLTMKEANEIHAIFMDSYPPIWYLNGRSFEVIDKVFELNSKSIKAAYTFDAGPNPFILTLRKDFEEIFNHFKNLGFKVIEAL